MSIALRFWFLLSMILCGALVASASAVRLVSVPFLTEFQQQAIEVQAGKVAQNVEARLTEEQLLMRFLASDPNIINIALGYVELPTYLFDRLEAIEKTEALSWVTLYDAFGEPLTAYDVRSEDRLQFPRDTLDAFVETMIEASLQSRKPVLLFGDGAVAHIVMAKPVLSRGFVEGLLVSGYQFDLQSLFPPNEIAEKTTLAISPDATTINQKDIVANLERLGLYVVLTPDVDAVESIGRTLLRNTTTAIAAVLLAAFGVFALLSRRVIIEPHRKLEIQRKELAELAEISKLANDSILVTDIHGKILWANPSFERTTGYTVEELLGKTPGKVLQGKETDPETVATLRAALSRHEPVKVEIRNYSKTGDHYWIDLSISPLVNAENECYGFVAISNDITEARQQREQIIAAKHEIEHQAMHDALTGLPNRRALDAALKKRHRFENSLATLVRIDLDHFKYVNDTMGHKAGDFTLVEVARIMLEETAPDDLAVRVGGDEFVVLMGPDKTADQGAELAQRMLTRIREPMSFENKVVRVGASFGVASNENGFLAFEELLSSADAALYEAKELGRNRVRLYTPELHTAVLSRRDLARDLRRALAQEEFEPYFQPQFDAQTFEITGVETLARWQSPDLGLVQPDRFLPVAKQLSILEEIDDIIFRKSIEQIGDLIDEGINIPRLSVNVTAERINDPVVFKTVMQHKHRVPEIAFEILESVLVEEQSDHFRFGLDQLREAGIKIEIDDFGSGHASIVGLMHLRPDAMKIDQQLIKPITTDALASGMLKSIVKMAGLMRLSVIAEGVETLEHAEMLRNIGVDVLQGYAFAKPMPITELRQFVLQFDGQKLNFKNSA